MIVAATVTAGLILGHIARWSADGLAVNLQLYFHAFRLHNIATPWVNAPLRFLSAAVLQYSALACWGIGWGLVMNRSERRSASRLLLLFAGSVAAGIAFTATSVRLSQPQFFSDRVWSMANPAVAGTICVGAAWLAARAERRGTWAPENTIALLVIALGLGWWSITDVSHAMAYGCMPAPSFVSVACPAPHVLSGIATVGVVSLPTIYMAWKTNWLGKPS